MNVAVRPVIGNKPALIVGAAAIGAGALGAVAIAGAPLPVRPLVLPAILAGPAAVVVLANWRAGVYLFLAWLILEDLFRKFAGNDMRIYFAKDVLAVLLYIAFLASRARGAVELPRVRFAAPLLAFAGWGLVQVFNPNSPSLIYGALGLRMYLFYVPLFLIGYALVRDERDLQRFLAFNLAIAAVVAALGIAQGVLGLSFLNPQEIPPELNLAALVRRAPISGALVPRPSSVFVSDGRFAWYLLTMFLLGVGALAYLAVRRGRGVWPTALAVAIVLAAIVISGSRGTFVYALGSSGLVVPAFLHGVGPRLRRGVARALAAGLTAGSLGLVAVMVLYPEAVGARWSFYYETIAPWSRESELAWRVYGYPVTNLLGAFTYPSWPMGYGIGTSSLGVQYVTGLLGLPAPGIGVESGYGTLILELGILGPVLWFLWTLALVREGWGVVQRLRDTPLFPLGFAILWFAFLLLFPFTFGGMQPYQNFVFNAYLWLLTGVLIRLPDVALSMGRR